MNLKSRKFIVILSLITLSLLITIPLKLSANSPKTSNYISHQSSIELLKRFLNHRLSLNFSIVNQTSNSIFPDYTYGFYTYQRLSSEISKMSFPDIQQRLNFINQTVKERFPHSKSLFRDNFYLDNNINSLLAFFGTGECFLSAEIFSYFTANLGLKSRISDIGDHSIAEVEYNNSWHLYDPQFLGYLPDKAGNNQDLKSIKLLAKNNLLKQQCSPLFQSPFPPKIFSFNLKHFNDGGNLKFTFYPLETRHFLEDLYLVASDGYHLEKFPNYQEYIKNYQGLIGNFIREIPIDPIQSDSINLVEKSPILAIYLINDQPITTSPLSIKDSGLKGQETYGKKVKIDDTPTVTDYSSIITQNLDYYTNSITINNIAKFKKSNPNSKLIIINQYSLTNLDTKEFLEISRKNGLKVTLY